MTENQINYILKHHKKYLSIIFGVTEQAVFKWHQRGKMPDKYFEALKKCDVSGFFDFIKSKKINDIENQIEREKSLVFI